MNAISIIIAVGILIDLFDVLMAIIIIIFVNIMQHRESK